MELLVFGAIVYFFPSMVASIHKHPNQLAIFTLNIFGGWTLIGWVGALVWAVTKPKPAPQYVIVDPRSGQAVAFAGPQEPQPSPPRESFWERMSAAPYSAQAAQGETEVERFRREHPVKPEAAAPQQTNTAPVKVQGMGFAMTCVGVFVALVVGLPFLAYLLSS